MRLGRPLPPSLFLPRPRLLKQLPREPGYLVLLEAPYGYGKSVLLGQWAEALAGFRRIWIGLLPGEDPRARLWEALELPPEAPWRAVQNELERTLTLLVFDDLAELEPIAPLLEDPPALLGVASRSRLAHPALAKLAAAGRLVRLGAQALAFTPEEAARLVGDEARGRALFERTGGWPIALHLAAATGEPDWPSLVAGLRASLAPELYEELLLLAAVRELPEAAAREPTRRLAAMGLLQRAENGYRLHAALAEALPEAEVRAALLRRRERIPGALLGRAFERLGLFEELAALLEASAGEGPVGADPEDVLRWDRQAPGPRGTNRRMRVAIARLNAGDRPGAVRELLALARDPKTPPLVALEAYGVAFYELAGPGMGRTEEALLLVEEARRLEPAAQGDPSFLARYLSNVASVHYYAGEAEKAAEILEQAIRLLTPEDPFFHVLAVNLATLRFELEGDLLGHRRVYERAVAAVKEGRIPAYVLDGVVWVELARDRALLGEPEAAKALLGEVPRYVRERLAKLAAELERAHLERDEAGLREALFTAELLADAELADRARGYLAARLLEDGRREEAARAVEGAKGFFARLVRARLEEDPAALPGAKNREEKLHLLAARYRLGDREALDQLLALTNARERVLPALLPLSTLPKDRPELARAYPLAEVLASGWKAAVRLRLREIPPLRVRVLGTFEVRGPLGRVELSGRARELFALLLLGLDRDAILEAIWPEVEADRARNNLYVQINHLRKLLEPWGVPAYLTEAGLVRVESDWHALWADLAEGRVEAALARYREPVFPGVDNPRVDATRIELREALIRAALARGGDAGLYARLFALDPANPEVFAAYARALKEAGDEAALAEAYRRFKAAFEAELETPAPALSELLRPA